MLSPVKKSRLYNEMTPNINKLTAGFRLCQESVQKTPETLLDLLQQALSSCVRASYVLFDSWFSFLTTIKKVLDQNIHVICMPKSMHRVYYGYQGQPLTLNVYKAVPVQVSIVCPGSSKFTTNLDLPYEEIIRIYGKRWVIGVFFKMTKSYLR